MPDSQKLAAVDNEGTFSHSSHDVRLQRLDTYLPYTGTPSGKLKYTVDNFAGTEKAWDNALAVFVPEGVPVQHVDHTRFAHDAHAEAARLGYRIVGHHADTKVIDQGPGEPRVMTKAVFTDPAVDRLAREGKLSVSSGFDAEIIPGEDRMAGTVTPNHVLYFIRNEPTAFGTKATPNDLGAMVDNLQEQTPENTLPGTRMIETEETKTLLEKIAKKVDNIREHVVPKPEDLQAAVDNLRKESEDKTAEITTLRHQVTEKDTTITELQKSKDQLDNLLAQKAEETRNQRWQEVKNLYKPALFHKTDDETRLRNEFEQDPAGFVLANVSNLAPAPAKQEAQGKSAIGNVDSMEKIDTRKAAGVYDATTKSMRPLEG